MIVAEIVGADPVRLSLRFGRAWIEQNGVVYPAEFKLRTGERLPDRVAGTARISPPLEVRSTFDVTVEIHGPGKEVALLLAKDVAFRPVY